MNVKTDPIIDHGQHTSEEHRIRLEKVEKLRAMGIEPWPEYKEVDATAAQLIASYTGEENTKNSAIAGRLMSVRLHGKAAFATLQDLSGRIQLYIKADIVGDDAFNIFEHLIDIGDVIWCKGTVFKTKMGEITLKVSEFTLMSKCLHPLPEKFHGIHDIEIKYRQRYLDLITDEQAKQRFIKRSLIVSAIRSLLDAKGYLEVETPMLHPIVGGAAAKPFVTHHNALGHDFYLRIAPELYLKRLVVGGLNRVYEINRNFRNEGISTRHNPEFTMIELYTAYEDFNFSMNLVEEIIRTAALKALGTLQVPYHDTILDFAKPFERISIHDAIIKYGKFSDADISKENIDATLEKSNIKHMKKSMYGEKLLALFEEFAEPHFVQPTFAINYPIETSPLTKRDPKNPDIAPRFELFVGRMELSNGYNELNDPFDQAERFREQVRSHAAGNDEAHQFDADYVQALEYGLPPTSGIGIGIDRLVMLLTNAASIKDVILFPTLKKKD